MQIDTWNRDAGDSPKFHPGPRPKSSRIPPEAGYNGLLECPCSDRLARESHMTYSLLEPNKQQQQQCAEPVHNATECWTAAQKVVSASKIQHHDVSSASNNDNNEAVVPGCSLEQHVDGSMDVYWKELKEDETELNFVAPSQEVVAFASAQINVSVALASDTKIATITMVGPSDQWFGVGFGTDSMCLHMQADECPTGGPYAIIVSGEKITERKLGHHGPGVELSPSVTVVSNTVTDENRTVVLTRPFQVDDDKGQNYFVFDPAKEKTVKIIMARGCSLVFAQHCGHGPAKLNFVAMDTPTSVCQAGIQGTIDGRNFPNNRCAPFPASDLLVQKNPTCFFEEYVGGLSCCKHMEYLLDKDQEIPWKDQVLEYHMKFRFYFEDYQPSEPAPQVTDSNEKKKVPKAKPASHKNLHRLYRQTEANAGEYDIVQCPEGTPPSQCVQIITSQWEVARMIEGCQYKECDDITKVVGTEIIYAAPHCHAPSCISMELYNADTGQLLCRVEPVYGTKDETVYEERNFLALPPCLWGSEDNLADPIFLPVNTTLLSIKRNNNTLPHTGEMASWQMRGYVFYKDDEEENNNDSNNEDVEEGHEQDKEEEVVADEDVVVINGEDKFMTQTKTAIRRGRRGEV